MKSEVRINCNQLQITRVFDAPRHLVFDWWTRAEKLQQWSGCKETVRCEVDMDFRVGGWFTQKMKIAVNGQTCEFSFRGTYDEIVEPERIVYHADFGPFTTRVTVEFFAQGNGTKVVLTQEGLPDELHSHNISRGTLDSFDKLEALLASPALVPAL